MKGLTPQERRWLTSDDVSRELAETLEARGLVVTGVCVICGRREADCAPGCNGDITMPLTALGLLALRLDAAARATSTVTT